jgi:hypothetical protein
MGLVANCVEMGWIFVLMKNRASQGRKTEFHPESVVDNRFITSLERPRPRM